MLQYGVQQCQNILSLNFSQLLFKDSVFFSHSQYLCSKRIWLIKIFQKPNWFLFFCTLSFFFFFLPLTLDTEVKQTKMIFPPRRQLMRIVWQPHDFEGDPLLRLRFHVKERFSFAGLPLSTSDDQSRVRKDSFWSLTSGSLLLSILYDAHPSYILFLVSRQLQWCSGNRYKYSPSHIFWLNTVKSWQILVSHTVLCHPSWLQRKLWDWLYLSSAEAFPRRCTLRTFYRTSNQPPQKQTSISVDEWYFQK